MVHPEAVTFEHHRHGDSLGVGETEPRFSWRFSGTEKDWIQHSYKVRISSSDYADNKDSKSIEKICLGSDSVLVPWPCRELLLGETMTVQVSTRDSPDSFWSPWSPPSKVEIGLLRSEDWTSKMIAAPRTISTSGSLRPALFRKMFRLASKVKSARLYITAYGLYEASINGKRVGDHVLAPGWTSYKYHLNYQTFDVTPLLNEGDNVIGAEVGEGWYAGRIGYLGGQRFIYGDTLALLAQLRVTLEDGTTATIVSDNTWKSSVSPRVSSEICDGEIYDARSEIPGWSSAPFDDTYWSSVTELELPFKKLRAPVGPPVRRIEVVKPKQILPLTPSGKIVIDFGQNLVGWLKIRVSGPPGHTILFHHVEVLEDGEIAINPLRFCKATDTVILAGEELIWEPKFTFHGFRYVQVDNWPSPDGNPPLENIEAVVVHTDMERTGWFECSDTGDFGVNQLHENIVWGMKGNFVSIPTDCPQRDERLGWTGDIQVFCQTANFLYDTSGMLSGWLKDLAIEQEKELDGVIGEVVPMLPGLTRRTGTAAWSDAGIIVPWELWKAFRDRKILSTQLRSMVMWLEKGVVRRKGVVKDFKGDYEKELWDPTQFQYGDWLDPDAPPNDAGAGKTDPQFVANAYLVHVSNILVKACESLGTLVPPSEMNQYKQDAMRMKRLFQDEYVTANGRMVHETMTSLSLAIEFDLLSLPSSGKSVEKFHNITSRNAERLSTAKERLLAIVKASGFRIETGFVGTPLILPALTRVLEIRLAYQMLHQKQCPSWLYPLTMGATTQWERWDSMLPSGKLNTGEMTSFNHYALGSVASWLHSTVGGISAARPGWKVIRIEPRPGGDITSASVKHLSPYGMIICEWEIFGQGGENKAFRLQVTLPPNTTGEVVLPGSSGNTVTIGSGFYEEVIPLARNVQGCALKS
ncbi:alpha-L-rhamnosidase [Diplocarpon rosae]|nr:alpha-L-rhamnosidase [Diplocarpon rosae]